MTKIYGSLVMKDEADRYLKEVLEWNSQFLDGIFVYDDNSTDDSVLIAEEFGCAVVSRGVMGVSFLQNESKFRSDAWTFLKSRIVPTEKDWIFSFDADEFIVSDEDTVSWSLERAISATDSYTGINIPIHEVFQKKDDGTPRLRTDGFWGQINAPRLFKFRKSPFDRSGAMACGSEPQYVIDGKVSKSNCGVSILHYGYLDVDDRVDKYNRYKHSGGHNPKHVDSIIAQGSYVDWTGSFPDVQR